MFDAQDSPPHFTLHTLYPLFNQQVISEKYPSTKVSIMASDDPGSEESQQLFTPMIPASVQPKNRRSNGIGVGGIRLASRSIQIGLSTCTNISSTYSWLGLSLASFLLPNFLWWYHLLIPSLCSGRFSVIRYRPTVSKSKSSRRTRKEPKLKY